MQSVQNAAARLLTSARRCDHITSLLRQLHWLPVQRRLEFKIACLVHQSLASLAPTYLTTDMHLVSKHGRRPLRSSTDRTLTVPRTHNRFNDRSFAVAGPRLSNSLPISLRQISSFGQFRRYLKNHLFWIWEITAQCDAWFSALYKYSYLLTYLLTYLRGDLIETFETLAGKLRVDHAVRSSDWQMLPLVYQDIHWSCLNPDVVRQ